MAASEDQKVLPSSEFYSTKELNPNYLEIRREKHRFRHWKWSGIFPLEGGWIPDPHIIATPVFEFSDEVRERLPAPSRFQGFDVNPWFEDETSEVLIAIEAGGVVFPYRVSPRDVKGMKYGFVNGDTIVSFLDEDAIVFLTTLDFTPPVMIQIALPLSAVGSAVVHVKGSPGWDRIAGGVSRRCGEEQLGGDVCERFARYQKWKSPVP